jgi:hypothetical protein|tara:strand:+ start:182 stop:514 length:333 start_codon:yes stop_codon:yes gene_type:complete
MVDERFPDDISPEDQVTDGIFISMTAPDEETEHALTEIVRDLVKGYDLDEETVAACEQEATRQYDLYMAHSMEGKEFRARVMYRIMKAHLEIKENLGEGHDVFGNWILDG